MEKLNNVTKLTLLAVGLAALQSYLDHIGMPCYAHKYF